ARPIVGECAPFATRGHFPLRCQARAWHLPAGISSRRMSQETPLDQGDGAGSPARLRTVPALWFAALAEPRTKPAYLVERDDTRRVEHVLSFAGLDDLAARGRDFASAHPRALDQAIAAIGEDDLYTFIFTSGTTGPPKACMIRHRNAYEMASVFGASGGLAV